MEDEQTELENVNRFRQFSKEGEREEMTRSLSIECRFNICKKESEKRLFLTLNCRCLSSSEPSLPFSHFHFTPSTQIEDCFLLACHAPPSSCLLHTLAFSYDTSFCRFASSTSNQSIYTSDCSFPSLAFSFSVSWVTKKFCASAHARVFIIMKKSNLNVAPSTHKKSIKTYKSCVDSEGLSRGKKHNLTE